MNDIVITPDIPRLYTALAEWMACIVYISVLKRSFGGWKLVSLCFGALAVQAVFLEATGGLPIAFWIPSMISAIAIMFLFIYIACDVSFLDAGYFCVRAFVAAEFVASFEWQIHSYIWSGQGVYPVPKAFLLFGIYIALFYIVWVIEKKHIPDSGKMHVQKKEFWSAFIIGVSVFAISNLSFISARTPFSGEYAREIFNIRTMVNLGGVAILFAHHVQCCELRVRRELEAMRSIWQNQYNQYQRSKESIEIINYKYHDIKNQIAALRAEDDPEKRDAYLTEMENDIMQYEAQNKTGNKVLDTILTSKNIYCLKNHITLTCVADGSLLSGMNLMDICTIFGNALDNAIECEKKIEDREKRLIHISLAAQKGFIMIRFENYFEGELDYDNELPETTKSDSQNHGFGLKSIRYSVQKYGGAVRISNNDNWFQLQILIPLIEENPKE